MNSEDMTLQSFLFFTRFNLPPLTPSPMWRGGMFALPLKRLR